MVLLALQSQFCNHRERRMKRRVHDDLERILDAARRHGEQSEPDHEAGDLQEVLRTVWPHVPLPVRREILKTWPISGLLEDWAE